MHNLILQEPPPSMDAFAPEFCFCGKKTVESHEFWFCSTQCAREDALRALDDPQCHYRDVVRKAYHRAGVPELYPRRMMSADHLRPTPQGGFGNAPPPFIPPINPSHQRDPGRSHKDVQSRIKAGFPTLSQVTSKVLSKKATAGESAIVTDRPDGARRQVPPNGPSRAIPVGMPQDHTFEQISLDAIPLPEHAPVRPLRRVPQSRGDLKSNVRESVAAFLNVGRPRKTPEGEKVFGHPANIILPPARKESLPSYRPMNPAPGATPDQRSRALRRSASFAGWNANGPHEQQDLVMHIIEEMREEMAESFDPTALFSREEAFE